MLIPVILSGGSGTELWPLSRESYPKQLLPLVGKGTMLQETLSRFVGVEDVGPPIVVCNEEHRFLVAEQILEAGIKPQAIVLEPVGRNTAPAVAVAAMIALSDVPSPPAMPESDPLLLILPADHVIRDVRAFRAALEVGRKAAMDNKLVTFGTAPKESAASRGHVSPTEGTGPGYLTAQFVDATDLTTTKKNSQSNGYSRSTGIFLFRGSVVLKELRTLTPAIYEACAASISAAKRDLDFTRLPTKEFGACPNDSFDHAIIERTKDGAVVPLDAGWSDVHSWSALHEAIPADDHGNVALGDVLATDSHGCYLRSTSRLVTAIGLKDHVVVETKDAVLVAAKSRVQDVNDLVAQLKKRGRYETSLHREVFRPWGSYDSIDSGKRFQVKRLMVKPGASMSLQLHHHRAEHWIVVAGTARITRGEDIFLLEENQSTYIPLGTKHRIENPGKIPLHIIEVQSGTYLGEDDIVRFEDRYGREQSVEPSNRKCSP